MTHDDDDEDLRPFTRAQLGAPPAAMQVAWEREHGPDGAAQMERAWYRGTALGRRDCMALIEYGNAVAQYKLALELMGLDLSLEQKCALIDAAVVTEPALDASTAQWQHRWLKENEPASDGDA